MVIQLDKSIDVSELQPPNEEDIVSIPDKFIEESELQLWNAQLSIAFTFVPIITEVKLVHPPKQDYRIV